MVYNSAKAMIFDSDGTLLDTRELIFEGYKTVLQKHGLEDLANDQYIRQRLGKPTIETFKRILADHSDKISPNDLANELDEIQNETSHLIKQYPHALQVLNDLKLKGVKLCLFTSGYSYMIDRNFTAAGIPNVHDIFDAIVTADHNIAHKPEPDAILHLLRQVNISPQNAIVVGDHAYDMLAGNRARAGLKIGLLHGIGTQHELLTAGADFLCNDLNSLMRLVNLDHFSNASPTE